MESRTGEGTSGVHGERTVTVKQGDTIWGLAQQVYGGTLPPLAAIYEANHQSVQVKNEDGKRLFVAPTIRAGEKLVFPTREQWEPLTHEFFRAHSTSIAPTLTKEVATNKFAGVAIPEAANRDKQSVEKVPGSAPDVSTVVANLDKRIGNVAESLTDGLLVGGLREGIYESCQDPLGTAARVGTAVALGAAFGVATGGVGFVAEAAGALGVGLTVAGAFDFLNPFDKKNAARNEAVAKCVNEAWNAPDRTTLDHCNWKMEKALGRPGFDLALGLIGGHAGSRFGRCLVPPRLSILPPTRSGLPKLESSNSTPTVRVVENPPVRLASSEATANIERFSTTKLFSGHGPRRLTTTRIGPALLEDRSIKGVGAADASLVETSAEIDRTASVTGDVDSYSGMRESVEKAGGYFSENEENFKAMFPKQQLDRLNALTQRMREKGIPFALAPDEFSGWKIHMAVEDRKSDALTRAIAQHLVENKISFKIGMGGQTEDGKGMTVYVGDRDTTISVARDLEKNFGDRLPKIPPIGDAAVQDELIGNSDKIAARFHIRSSNFGPDDWHQYGYHGIPFQNKYMDFFQNFRVDLRAMPIEEQHARLTEVEHQLRPELEKRYGAFFAGSDKYL